jgi:hypothetical protein
MMPGWVQDRCERVMLTDNAADALLSEAPIHLDRPSDNAGSTVRARALSLDPLTANLPIIDKDDGRRGRLAVPLAWGQGCFGVANGG